MLRTTPHLGRYPVATPGRSLSTAGAQAGGHKKTPNSPTVHVDRQVWGVDRAINGQLRMRVAARTVVGALTAVFAAKSPPTEFQATVGALSY
jgi:hypothetical protein